jgi:hypothetical protein
VHIPDPPAKPSSRAEVIEKRKERQRGFSLKSKRLRLEAKKLTQRVDELLIPHKEKWEDLKREHDKLMREHDYWKKQNELSTGLIPPPARISSLQPPASASQPHAGPSNAPNAPHNPPRLPPVRYAEQKVKLKARIKDLERGLDPWEGECQNLKNWNSALLEECERLKEQDLATTEKTIQAGGTPLIASQ